MPVRVSTAGRVSIASRFSTTGRVYSKGSDTMPITTTGATVVSGMLRRRSPKAQALIVALLVAGLLGIFVPGAVSATSSSWKLVPTPSPSVGGSPNDVSGLYGVAATSAKDAWAVGDYYPLNNGLQTLILRWNGTKWAQVKSPNPGPSPSSDALFGVAATSATNAWAVGYYGNVGWTGAGAFQTLILHWNGTKWTKVASPNPSGSQWGSVLYGVAATSATNAWAVGVYAVYDSGFTPPIAYRTLILHWNGIRWTQVASPNAGGSSALNYLHGVAATSASNAWAVGQYTTGDTADRTLILHWNGTSWTQVASPNPDSSGYDANYLSGVAATSASNAWAVGTNEDQTADIDRTLILHWNGAKWTKVASPSPALSAQARNDLSGVAATSTSNAWAVGQYYYLNGETQVYRTLVLHWNGTKWTKVASPSPAGYSNFLSSVAATSASNAWAVGDYYSYLAQWRTLAIRWQ